MKYDYSLINLISEYNKNKIEIDNYLNNNVVENFTRSTSITENNTENNTKNNTENNKILGLGMGVFLLLLLSMLIMFLWALYLVLTSRTINEITRVVFIILLLFSGPLQLLFSFGIILYIKYGIKQNIELENCLKQCEISHP